MIAWKSGLIHRHGSWRAHVGLSIPWATASLCVFEEQYQRATSVLLKLSRVQTTPGGFSERAERSLAGDHREVVEKGWDTWSNTPVPLLKGSCSLFLALHIIENRFYLSPLERLVTIVWSVHFRIKPDSDNTKEIENWRRTNGTRFDNRFPLFNSRTACLIHPEKHYESPRCRNVTRTFTVQCMHRTVEYNRHRTSV